MSINTIDAIQDEATKAGTGKQTGNTTAFLTHTSPTARGIRSLFGGLWGIGESLTDVLGRTTSLTARPQDIAEIKNITRNGIKTIFAEKPAIETSGTKEYISNLRAPKLQRDSGKAYHEPYHSPTNYYNTHTNKYSLAPKKTDKRYQKALKFIPYTAGKAIKIPARGITTAIWGIGDIFRRAKVQQPRKLISGKFIKNPLVKSTMARKKLTSRSSKTTTETPSKENKTSSMRGRLPRNRKKNTQEAQEETQEKKETTKESEKKESTTQKNEITQQQEKIKQQQEDIQIEKKKLEEEKKKLAKERKELDTKQETKEKANKDTTVVPLTPTNLNYIQQRQEREKNSEKHIDIMKNEVKTMKDTFDKKVDRSNQETLGEYVEEYATLENIAKDIEKTGKRKKMGTHEKKKRQKALESYQTLQESTHNTKIAA